MPALIDEVDGELAEAAELTGDGGPALATAVQKATAALSAARAEFHDDPLGTFTALVDADADLDDALDDARAERAADGAADGVCCPRLKRPFSKMQLDLAIGAPQACCISFLDWETSANHCQHGYVRHPDWMSLSGILPQYH